MHYLLLVIFSSVSCIAFASSPQGFKLIAGDARAPVIDPQGVITISSGKHAIVHWDKFSIGKGSCVRFAQADATSAILNRVVGFSESKINGSLLSNGKVFLINKNGVVIGPHGHIETAGFVGSTLDLVNEDFLKGKELLFKGDSGKKVVNLGTIIAKEGDVVLIGQHVDNQGSIRAPQGHVLLGCGQEILLQPKGEEHIFIRLPVSASEEEPQSSVLEHSGTIETLVAELKCGVTPFTKAIKSSGKIDALAIHEEGGKVFLVAENGRVDISGQIVAKQGEYGGNIQLLGKEVYLLDGADIEASGNKGGGEILVGGDFQGKNPKVLNADLSFVAKNAAVRANAHIEGDGGKVIVWGEEATGYFGHIEAKGGYDGGDGGLTEVSGSYLEFKGLVDTSAPKGNFGQLLLDPLDLTISSAADSCPSCPACFSASGTYQPCCVPSENLSTSTLINQLALSNVTVTTSPCSTGSGVITVSDSISWASNDLTLNAAGDLNINASIFNTGAGNIFLSSAGNSNVTNSISAGIVNASITGSLTMNGGSISAISENLSVGGDLSMTGSNISVSTGALNLIVGRNLSMTGSGILGGPGSGDPGDLLILVGNSATLSQNSQISTAAPRHGGNITIVVDNANPSSIGPGTLTIGSPTDSTNSITAAPGMATRIFAAVQDPNCSSTISSNCINSMSLIGNGSPPTTFTPGTPFVNTTTEMWGIFYPTDASLFGVPYTFFYKQPSTSSPVRLAAINSVAVSNTVLTNLFSTQNPGYVILTTNPPNGTGQAIPLTQNENEKAHNDTMSCH